MVKKIIAGAAVTGGLMFAGAGVAAAHDGAHAEHSPGVGSGNVIILPVDVDTNVCGNTIDFIGFLNPAVGNRCVNK
ncbi:chaplin [Streptomyces gamaensis]|uniref:Chaplin n=1 Tax=Streptomyces gamaensis TaxID=1763542 RepID=A0ABW0ZEH0_9ACTN